MENFASTLRRVLYAILITEGLTVKGAKRKSLKPWVKDEVEYYQHQVDGIRELCRRKSFLLADDMGLGKSLQALTVFAIDVAMGYADTAIVVCPVSLKGNWSDEIEKFTRIPCTVLQGTPSYRNQQITMFLGEEGPRILIVNYEQVVAHLDILDVGRFDVAIFDEAHYLKNPKAKRTKACLNLYSKRSFLLTGTPMLNHIDELWSILHRINPKEYPKYWTFVNRYAVFGGWKDKQIIGVKNEKSLLKSSRVSCYVDLNKTCLICLMYRSLRGVWTFTSSSVSFMTKSPTKCDFRAPVTLTTRTSRTHSQSSSD